MNTLREADPGDRMPVGVGSASARLSPAVAAGADKLVPIFLLDPESDFPWHTCIADTPCRTASALPILHRTPLRLLRQSHQSDRFRLRWRHRNLRGRTQRRSPHPARLLPASRPPLLWQGSLGRSHLGALRLAATPTACMSRHQTGILQRASQGPEEP